MYNFFVDEKCSPDGCYYISGSDYNHIKNVLHLQIGERFLVSHRSCSHLCELERFENASVIAKIIEENYTDSELPIKIYLFQGLPKADKMEFIIQKCVELGAFEIIPTAMERSIVKLDDKKGKAKQVRWQAISESAAKQSKRNIIPSINEPLSFKKALEIAQELDLILVPYENKDGMSATKEALSKIKKDSSVGIFIGPEGGFSDKEIDALKSIESHIISLGKRILRTETAALTTVSMCMLYTEMNLSGDNK